MCAGHTRAEILNYTIPQARGYLDAIAQIEKERRFDMLMSSKAALADGDGFRDICKILGLDDG